VAAVPIGWLAPSPLVAVTAPGDPPSSAGVVLPAEAARRPALRSGRQPAHRLLGSPSGQGVHLGQPHGV
jgi:hypothetical protein